MTSRRSLLLSCGALAALAAACGGAAPEAQAPRSAPEPTTVEEAQAQIAKARAELGVASTDATSDAAPTAAPPPPPPAPDAPTVTKSEDMKKSVEVAPSSGAESKCTSPCRALASMRRAVTALCRMTGDDDNRCRDARKTLQTSEARVTPCTC